MRKIKTVLVIYKKSTYETHVLRDGFASTATLRRAHDEHKATIKSVKVALEAAALNYKMAYRLEVGSTKRFDLIITLGGDGTFLRASRYVAGQLMLGVNSAPSNSVGALTSIQGRDFASKLNQIMNGDFHVEKWHRLRLRVNGKALPHLVLNDVLLSNICPATTSRYKIYVGRKRENHKSSGLWVATARGTTAAIAAAGGVQLSADVDQFQYLVREPFHGKRTPYHLTRGLLSSNQTLILINEMKEGALYLDGVQEMKRLHFGDRVEISLSKKPVTVIV